MWVRLVGYGILLGPEGTNSPWGGFGASGRPCWSSIPFLDHCLWSSLWCPLWGVLVVVVGGWGVVEGLGVGLHVV
jgi:hypothetical protein